MQKTHLILEIQCFCSITPLLCLCEHLKTVFLLKECHPNSSIFRTCFTTISFQHRLSVKLMFSSFHSKTKYMDKMKCNQVHATHIFYLSNISSIWTNNPNNQGLSSQRQANTVDMFHKYMFPIFLQVQNSDLRQ